MFRQAQSNYFELLPVERSVASAGVTSSIRLGPLQRLKLSLGLPIIRQGTQVRVPPKPFWVEKGWRQVGSTNQYVGQYQAVGHTWQGQIDLPYPGGYTAYIWHPPLDKIRSNTHHGPCFMPNGEAGRFQIYFHSNPSSLDHAISSIERVLSEAHKRRRK